MTACRFFNLLVFTCILIAGLLPVNVLAQTTTHYNYSIDQGLPSSETYDVMQDSKGFIWIATDRGVARYNGYEFKVFTTNDGLPSNTVFTISEDRFGRLWFLSLHNHLAYFANNKIHPYKFNHVLEKNIQGSPNTRSIYVDKDSSLYISYYNYGIIHVDPKGRIRDLIAKEAGYLTVFALAAGNTTLYGSFNDAKALEKSSIKIVTGSLAGYSEKSHPGISLQDFYQVMTIRRKNGAQLISTYKNILEYLPGSQSPNIYSDANVIRLYEDKDSCLWICRLRNGAKRLFPNSTDANRYQLHVLENKTITGVLQDNEGGFWFTTLESGLYYFPQFKFFKANTPMSTRSTEVLSIEARQHAPLFVGYTKGVVEEINGLAYTQKFNIDNSFDSTARVYCLWYDTASHTLWAGGIKGLFKKANGKSFVQTSPHLTRAIYITAANAHFITSGLNVHTYSAAGYAELNPPGTVAHIEDMCADRQGNIVMADANGLYVYNIAKNTLLKSSLLRGIRVKKVKKMDNGNMVYATLGKGIVIDSPGKRIVLDEKAGMVSDFVNAIACAHDTIWAATTRGISRIVLNGKQTSIHNFTQYNGLPTNEIREIGKQGPILWLGTRQGLYWVNINQLSIHKTGPVVYMDEISVNNKSCRARSTFAHTENNFTFTFFALNYKKRGHIAYRYRLQGYDNAWQHTYNRNVQYLSLPYGAYCFEVQAQNQDGYWSAQSTQFKFMVYKPFYLEWWFVTACLSFTVAVVYFFVRRRIAAIRQKNNVRLLMNEYKGIALASQINPHFLFNSLNSIQSFILHEDRITAAQYLSALARLMRKSLEHSRVDYVPVSAELDLLSTYLGLEQLRFRERFTYAFEIDPNLDQDKTCIPSMILQPFIENSIRHGLIPKNTGDGKVTIRLYFEGALLKCEIDDNGVGRKATAEKNKATVMHKSHGIDITVERIKMYCLNEKSRFFFEIKDKFDSFAHSAGTHVAFYLPYRIKEA